MTPSGNVLLFGFLICASLGGTEKKTEAELPLHRSTCGLYIDEAKVNEINIGKVVSVKSYFFDRYFISSFAKKGEVGHTTP